jgi:RHS repeat-associated protein
MYNAKGEKTWEADLDIYGKVRTFAGRSLKDCPFRYQGQYEDSETGLYYNRFRYYDPNIGGYISQDPIGLAGNNPTLYGYVKDTNSWVDEFGLECWKTARQNFWKQEAANNQTTRKYSQRNLNRMSEGKAPKMTVEVTNRSTGITSIKDYSLELHHTIIPQRVGGTSVHNASNLTIVTPWQHEAIDPFRIVGYDLDAVIRGVDVW